MAEKLTVDNGLLELYINGNGILRFNASDPNVYKRFYELAEELPKMEERYKLEVEEQAQGQEEASAEVVVGKMYEIDAELKRRLNQVFGPENDFDRLLGGVNLMAFGRNGERVVTNLFDALEPYVKSGSEMHMKSKAAEAVAEAKQNRAQRRAKK